MSLKYDHPTNCTNCGAPLKNGKCEYCGAQYDTSYEVICIESPKVERVQAEARIPRYYFETMDSEDLSKSTLDRLAHQLAKGLAGFMKIVTEYDYLTGGQIIRGEVRIVPPDFRF